MESVAVREGKSFCREKRNNVETRACQFLGERISRPISPHEQVLHIVRSIPKNHVLRDGLTPNLLVKLVNESKLDDVSRHDIDMITRAQLRNDVITNISFVSKETDMQISLVFLDTAQ